MSDDEDEDGEDFIEIGFGVFQWAEICAALKLYTETTKAPESRKDALFCLRKIDATMRGEDELPPPDDVLSAGEGD